MRECTYCGMDVDAHNPVVVHEGDADGSLVGHFCNYACLTAHVDEAGLTEGEACVWEPGDPP